MIGLRVLLVNGSHHGLVAQVGEQHEALRCVPRQNLWRFQTRRLHELGHFDEGFTIFFVWRRIHHDQTGALLIVHPQIPSKAGIR